MYIDRDRSTKIFCEFFPPAPAQIPLGWWCFFSNRRVPTQTPTPLPRDEDWFRFPGKHRDGRRRDGESSQSIVVLGCRSVGRTVRTRETRARGRRRRVVSLWLSDPLSLSRRVGPGADEEEGIGNRIKSNQINQSARRRRRVEESSRRREARGRVPDDRGARRGRRRRRIETKDTAV